jgi:hypothetical protein
LDLIDSGELRGLSAKPPSSSLRQSRQGKPGGGGGPGGRRRRCSGELGARVAGVGGRGDRGDFGDVFTLEGEDGRVAVGEDQERPSGRWMTAPQ